MKKNKCARCGNSESFGRVFEGVSHNEVEFFLCVDCAQILYKAEDARKEGNHEKETKLHHDFEKGIKDGLSKIILTDWLKSEQSSD